MAGSDERQCQRFELALVATVTGLSRSAPKEHKYLITKNLCGNGAFLLAGEQPKMDTYLSAELALPSHGLRLTLNGENFYGKMSGHVVRHESDGFAVAFDDEYYIDFWSSDSA